MDDYGHVDDETPSFAISLFKEYQGQGIGSQLMVRMLVLITLNIAIIAALCLFPGNKLILGSETVLTAGAVGMP